MKSSEGSSKSTELRTDRSKVDENSKTNEHRSLKKQSVARLKCQSKFMLLQMSRIER